LVANLDKAKSVGVDNRFTLNYSDITMRGRNTTMIGIRVKDEIADTFKALAKKNGCAVSDIIRPLLLDYCYKLFQDGILDKNGKLKKEEDGKRSGRTE